MRTYCSLVIASDKDHQLEATVKRVLGLSCSEFVDNRAPEHLARIARLNEIFNSPKHSPTRYIWALSSASVVDSTEAEDHVTWLLNQVRPGAAIHDIVAHGSSAYLTCFWAGNGRGGGPILSSTLARMLTRHEVELRFDIYFENDEVEKRH